MSSGYIMEDEEMKKMISLVLALMMACTLFAGCGSDSAETADNSSDETTVQQASADASEADDESNDASDVSDGLVDGTKFVVGFDQDFPPYGYADDNGGYTGFDLDLAKEVCDRNGWEFVAQPINWDSKDMELNAGTISCIWNGFTMSNDRLDDYEWSDPYIDNTQVVVVKADSGISSFADLAGKNVVVQTASSALEALEGDAADLAATFGTLDEVSDYNTAFMNLEAGAADAVAMDIGVAQYQISTREEGAYVILDEEISSEQYGIGFKKGNTALRDAVQKTLDEMAADGTVDEIAAKYADWSLADKLCIGQ
jgi:polar amino acid transport system substrate-binding protein